MDPRDRLVQLSQSLPLDLSNQFLPDHLGLQDPEFLLLQLGLGLLVDPAGQMDHLNPLDRLVLQGPMDRPMDL